MKRKKDITSYFCPQKKDENDKADAETELDRAEETCQKEKRGPQKESQ